MSSYSIIRRRYSSDSERDEYSLYSSENSLSDADRTASEATGDPRDILIVCDTAYVSDLPKYAESIYVIDEHGAARKAPNVHAVLGKNITWLKAWEGPQSQANDLLYAAAALSVDSNLVVTTACACARTALKYAPKGEYRALVAIETGEAWARGEATIEQVQKARNSLNYAVPRKRRAHYDSAAYYALYYESTHSAAYFAAAATVNFNTAIVELSALVREYIPLSVVLLAAGKIITLPQINS